MSEVMAIGTRTDNAQLMVDCAALGYIEGAVLDMTYGLGRFWKLYRPPYLTTNDLDASTTADYNHDFTKLPWKDAAFDTVIFDPPYKYAGTSTGEGAGALNADYGVGVYLSVAGRNILIMEGISEAARLARKWVIVKCQDQVVSGQVHWQTRMFADHGENVGLRLVDSLHVQGYRKQPPGRRQIHARRDYSTALVFAAR